MSPMFSSIFKRRVQDLAFGFSGQTIYVSAVAP